jgi:hypothetical protein
VLDDGIWLSEDRRSLNENFGACMMVGSIIQATFFSGISGFKVVKDCCC